MRVYQGDVGFESVGEVPEGAVEVQPTNGHYVLAWGEATGHCHAVGSTPDIKLYEKDGVLYLKVMEQPAEVKHGPLGGARGDHDTVTLEPGVMRVMRQKVYDYVQHAPRRVID